MRGTYTGIYENVRELHPVYVDEIPRGFITEKEKDLNASDLFQNHITDTSLCTSKDTKLLKLLYHSIRKGNRGKNE